MVRDADLGLRAFLGARCVDLARAGVSRVALYGSSLGLGLRV